MTTSGRRVSRKLPARYCENFLKPDRETTLGFLAGHTSRITLLAWVTAVTYREPGLLAKAVTTLDVLSGGRAWLGIGAGFYEAEITPLEVFAERIIPAAAKL
ncbi:MAG TPA: LLM class flavin-dependent oxidoreductase [Trebonia sp.]|nr:LLM class flavin-dependent oxidoreductase [Trebonia sp.]